MGLNLVPDIWLRIGVERHVGLLSYDDVNWSEEDDAFGISYTLIYLTNGGPLASHWGLHTGRGINGKAPDLE